MVHSSDVRTLEITGLRTNGASEKGAIGLMAWHRFPMMPREIMQSGNPALDSLVLIWLQKYSTIG